MCLNQLKNEIKLGLNKIKKGSNQNISNKSSDLLGYFDEMECSGKNFQFHEFNDKLKAISIRFIFKNLTRQRG